MILPDKRSLTTSARSSSNSLSDLDQLRNLDFTLRDYVNVIICRLRTSLMDFRRCECWIYASNGYSEYIAGPTTTTAPLNRMAI